MDIQNVYIKFYEILNLVNQLVSNPIINLSKDIQIPIVSVFLLGILGFTAPCQITSNLGAIGYIVNKKKNKENIMQNILWFSLGKIIIFLLYGVIINLFNIHIQDSSIGIFKIARKLIGPFVIFIGLYILGILKLKGSVGNTLIKNIDKYSNKFKIFNPSFIIGIIFSFSFCPTLFWLFFGIVVPVSIKSTLGIIYPAVFAIGMIIPMVIMIIILNYGRVEERKFIKSFRKVKTVIRILGGVLLIILGLIDSIFYWLI